MSEKLWYIKNCSLFDRLTPEELHKIEISSRAKAFPKKSPIYLPADHGDTVFLLASGRVKICHLTPDGKQSILAFIEPGEIFGEIILFSDQSRDEYAEAVENSTVVMIAGEAIAELMATHAGVSLGVTKMVGLRRQRIERRLKNLLFLSSRDRISHLLLDLMEQYGEQKPEGIRLTIKLSHQDLANIVGSTRETVTVVLGELQDEGLICVGRRKIVIAKPDRLATSVQASVPTLPVRRKIQHRLSPARNS